MINHTRKTKHRKEKPISGMNTMILKKKPSIKLQKPKYNEDVFANLNVVIFSLLTFPIRSL